MCPDGILSGLRMAELVSKKGKLSVLLSEIPSYPNIREKITCSKEAKIEVMNNMEDLLKDAFDDIKDINSIDGVRLTFEDGSWVLVRPSGTEDYIRITLESRDIERSEKINEICKKIIKDNI
jgi:phosphoglucosamine mutase